MSDLHSLTLNAALNEAVDWLTRAEYAQVVARCDDLLSSYPHAVRVFGMRARALYRMGEPARAAQDYARVLEIVPIDEQAMAGLIRCQTRLGQRREATLIARQLLDYDAGQIDALRLVREAGGDTSNAGCLLRVRQRCAAGFVNQAIAEVQDMLNAAPDRADLHVILAELLWRAGLRITTIELCQAILDMQLECLNASALLYGAWSQMGVAEMSATYLKAVERFDPDHRESVAWLKDRSPLSIQEVPARLTVSRGIAEDERDHSAWIDRLIVPPIDELSAASPVVSGPAMSTNITPPLPEQPPEPLEEKIIFPPPLLEWQPSEHYDDQQRRSAGSSLISDGEDEADVPSWLSGLREKSKPLSASDWDALTLPDSAEAQSNERVVASEFKPIEQQTASPSEQAIQLSDAGVSVAPLDWQPIGEKIDRPITNPPVESPAPVKSSRTVAKASRKRERASPEHLLSLARRAVEAAEYERAAQLYAQLVTLGKKLDEVLSDLDVATHAYPDVPEFYALLGRIYARKGNLNAALTAYRRALEMKD
ncbi:MAG: hypothetical protein RMN25_04745 [Anaerolineae bacterium]|nr:hypothetical protein [Thermoflexales bacterium]MDW8407072.1 hypothetical protein [Anaerolineae bacterium]